MKSRSTEVHRWSSAALVTMLDPRRLQISLRLRPPTGNASEDTESEDFVVAIEHEAVLPKDRISAWADEQQAIAPLCACGCGHPVNITRRHFWTGVPVFRSECRHRGMSRRRWELAKGLYTGQHVAGLLGIGRTTVNRWIASGKLPKPEKSISGMLLFPRDVIDGLVRQRGIPRITER